jgi:hypothetical protein
VFTPSNTGVGPFVERYTALPTREGFHVEHRESHPDLERFLQESRELLLSESVTVCHALFCSECELADQAEFVLALVGWDVASYLTAVDGRRD